MVGYWGELGAVDKAVELGCAGAAGDLCMDGSIGSRTSALHAPYADADTTGHLYLDRDQVAAHVVDCTRADLQAGFHVIGDRAVTELVAGFEAAAEVLGAPAVVRARHRVEHVEMATQEQMAVLGRLGVTASMQPMFDAYWGGDDSLYAQRLGADRARPMNAFASMNRAGVALAFGSDTPVTPFGPWAAVRAAAWHRTETRADHGAGGVQRAHPRRLARGPARRGRRDRRRRPRRASPSGTSPATWSCRPPTPGSPPGRRTRGPACPSCRTCTPTWTCRSAC